MEEIGVSFIIALKNGDDIVLVADKMLQKSNLAISTEQKKILDYSRNVTTAVAGNFGFAYAMVKYAESFCGNFDKTSFDDSYNAIYSALLNWVKLKKERCEPYQVDAVFIMAGINADSNANIKMIIFNNGDVMKFETPLVCNEVEYLFANPSDLSFETCNKLCIRCLNTQVHQEESVDLQSLACQIFQEVSRRIRQVSSSLDMWTYHQ